MRPQYTNIEKKVAYGTYILQLQQEITDLLDYGDFNG
jgi:hypothetical protein